MFIFWLILLLKSGFPYSVAFLRPNFVTVAYVLQLEVYVGLLAQIFGYILTSISLRAELSEDK